MQTNELERPVRLENVVAIKVDEREFANHVQAKPDTNRNHIPSFSAIIGISKRDMCIRTDAFVAAMTDWRCWWRMPLSCHYFFQHRLLPRWPITVDTTKGTNRRNVPWRPPRPIAVLVRPVGRRNRVGAPRRLPQPHHLLRDDVAASKVAWHRVVAVVVPREATMAVVGTAWLLPP